MKIRLYFPPPGENAFGFMAGSEIRRPDPNEEPLHIAVLRGGMTNGMPSVAISQKLPDGSYVFLETSGTGFAAAMVDVIMKVRNEVALVRQARPDVQPNLTITEGGLPVKRDKEEN